MGVEPTRDISCPPTDLKSAKPTGTYPLPQPVFGDIIPGKFCDRRGALPGIGSRSLPIVVVMLTHRQEMVRPFIRERFGSGRMVLTNVAMRSI
jgi:hypothetical protein